jgi:hypothetical protein
MCEEKTWQVLVFSTEGLEIPQWLAGQTFPDLIETREKDLQPSVSTIWKGDNHAVGMEQHAIFITPAQPALDRYIPARRKKRQGKNRQFANDVP